MQRRTEVRRAGRAAWQRWAGAALASAALLVGIPLTAEESQAGEAAGSGRLEDFVVIESPGRDPVQDAVLPAPSQGLSLSIIRREELEQLRPRTIIEALEFEPGVQVKRQGRKNGALLSLRGEGTMLVLLDGMYVGTWRDYRFLQSLPPSMVEEILIVRDSTSLLHGPPQFAAQSGAGTVGFGGVLDVRLREPASEHHGEVRGEVGSHRGNVQHLHLSGPVVGDRLQYLFSANRDSFDGPGGENMGSEFYDYLGRLVWRYWEDSTLTLTLHHERGWRELQLSDAPNRTFGWVEEYDPWESTIVMLSLQHVWNPDMSTAVNAFYRETKGTFRYHHLQREFDEVETKRGIDIRQTIRFPECNTLRLGVQGAVLDNPTGKLDSGGWFIRPNGSVFLRSIPSHETDYAFYVQDELVLLPDRLTLDGGLRWDRKSVREGFAVRNGAAVSEGGYWNDPAVSWSVGARLELTARQTLTARYALASEAVSEAYVTRTGTALDDCTETRYELGYEWRVHPALVVTVTGYWKEIDEGLVYDGQYQLSGEWLTAWRATDFDRYGYEVQAKGEIAEGLTYSASCTYIHSEDKDTGDPDDRLPHYLLAGGLQYATGPWKAAVGVQHTTRYQDDFNTDPQQFVDLGDFWLVDVNGSYTLKTEGMNHEFYGGVRNLCNEHYATVPGYKDPGLAVYAGYALRF